MALAGAKMATPGRVAPRRATVFRVPEELLARLDQLAVEAPTSGWAIRTADLLRNLTDPTEMSSAQGSVHSGAGSQASFGSRNTNSRTLVIDSERSARLLETLEECITDASEVAEKLAEGSLRTDVLRAQYALRRRVDLWTIAHRMQGTRGQRHSASSLNAPSPKQRLAKCLVDVAALHGGTPEGKAWNNYLMIERLEYLASETQFVSESEQSQIIADVLARIERAGQQEPQRRYVEQGAIDALEQELKHWLAEPVDLPQLLAQIESYESKPQATTARSLANNYRSLSWSADPDSQELGRRVDRHYRNANLRIALSSKLANRFLPKPKTVQQDIYDTILGADVQGVSNTSTQLSLTLIPRQGALRFSLNARGVVDSDTASSAGPATFHSEGTTWFQASKQFTLSPSGLIQSSPAVASADGVSDLLAVETDYDAIPLVRQIVRRIAISQHDKSHDMALEEVADKVLNTARERLDDEAEEGLNRIKNKVDQRVLTPTRNLDLSPEVIELRTTSKRVIARLRLAGENQLAAHTPRPRAPSDSYLSVQLHQSAVNNVMEQLKLDGRSFKLPELYRTVLGRFRGVEDLETIEVPEDLPRNASVTLAAENAMRVDFSDGKVHITLAIDRLRLRRSRYGPFLVHAIYRPEISGVHATLVREGVVQIETDKPLKAGSQIVLRGIVGKVFSRNRPLRIVTEKMANDPRLDGLCVNQFVLDDGWLGIALGPQRELVRRSKEPTR